MGITVEIYSESKLFKLVYGSGGSPKINGLEERIRFFSYRTLDREDKEGRFYAVAHIEDTLVGIAKMGNYDSMKTNIFYLSYISVDKNYRRLGISKMLLETVFKYSSKKRYCLTTSTYTYLGDLAIRKYMIHFSNKYNITFNDRTDSLLDDKTMYVEHKNSLAHIDEFPKEIRDKHWENYRNSNTSSRKRSRFIDRLLKQK